MKKLSILLLALLSNTVHASVLTFDGHWQFIDPNLSLEPKIPVGTEVSGEFDFDIKTPMTSKVDRSVSHTTFANSVVSAMSEKEFGHAILAKNTVVELSIFNNFNITSKVLAEHGLLGYVTENFAPAPQNDNWGDWDIISLRSDFTIKDKTTQAEVKGGIAWFGIFDKQSISADDVADYKKIYEAAVKSPSVLFGLEAQSPFFHGLAVLDLPTLTENAPIENANNLISQAGGAITSVPVPAMSWVFAAGCVALYSRRRKSGNFTG